MFSSFQGSLVRHSINRLTGYMIREILPGQMLSFEREGIRMQFPLVFRPPIK